MMTLKLIVALRSALLSQRVWATCSVSRVLILGKLRGFGACWLVSLLACLLLAPKELFT